jgi:hypothetical protein
VAFIAVVILISRIPAGNSGTSQTTGPGAVKMSNFKNQNAIVSLTTVGQMVGDSERRSIRVSVTPTERRIEILSGYDQNVTSSQSYENINAGYEAFLSAMDVAGFTKSKKPAIVDQKGVCPTGRQYVYDVASGGGHPVHLWGTSCATAQGTFAGASETIQQVFRAQIPDYAKQTASVHIQ